MTPARAIVRALLLLAAVAMHPLRVPAAELEALPVIAHETGDASSPRFSPDGRYLAYAVTVPRRGLWVDEVRAVRMSDGRRRVLVPARRTFADAAYGAPLLSLDWIGEGHLQAHVGDGDVGYTRFDVDVHSARIRRAEWFDEPMDSAPADAPAHWIALVPDWKPQALAHALAEALPLGTGRLLQKAYAGEDDHVWWLDAATSTVRRLLEIDDRHARLAGGMTHGGGLVFAVRGAAQVDVYRFDGDRLDLLLRHPVAATARGSQGAQLQPLRCRGSVCWFALRAGRGEQADVRVLRLDADGRISPVAGLPPGLRDIDVSSDGRLAAVTAGTGDATRLAIYRVRGF